MISLKELELKFQLHRQGSSFNRHIPGKLKQTVIECLQYYSPSEVLSATGLGKTTLYNWSKQNKKSGETECIPPNNNSQFISLDMLVENEKVLHNNFEPLPLDLSITLPNNVKVDIKNCNQENIPTLINSLLVGVK